MQWADVQLQKSMPSAYQLAGYHTPIPNNLHANSISTLESPSLVMDTC
jgi:hypothetical protein